jgi:hypothetical protein
VSDIRLYPAYTSLDRVRAELPPRYDVASLPDGTLGQYIDTRANELDGLLSRYYQMPARRLDSDGVVEEEKDPSTQLYLYQGFFPSQLETLNRYMAASDAMVRLLDLRANEEGNSTQFDALYNAMLESIKSGELILTYPFLHPTDPLNRPYFLALAGGSPLFGKHPLSARVRVQYDMPPRTFSENEDGTSRW